MRMNTTGRKASYLMVAALALPTLALPVAAFAQTAPANTMPPTSPQVAPSGGSVTAAPQSGTPPASTMPKAHMPMKHAAARHVVSPTERVDQRINQLHSELKITAAQQPQWDAFATVMRANATAANQAYMDRTKQLPTMTAVEDMQSYAALTMLHAQDVQKLSTAFGALYAALTPEQQKTADTVFRGAAKRHR